MVCLTVILSGHQGIMYNFGYDPEYDPFNPNSSWGAQVVIYFLIINIDIDPRPSVALLLRPYRTSAANQWKNAILFRKVINESNAHFIGIHMQEVGGKNFEENTNQVPEFVDRIGAAMHDMGYSTGRAYLDLEFEQPESYNVRISRTFRKLLVQQRER
ncbi:unnamed protein product [Gongylonema pulchrum]|uniref:Lig_chan-Glu_bd domain-containing protein n=1 Tax=Gongylonema pulchrum TaxID=637853 RepID=A0A183ER10_9BILA|nr:unnamed protein product [Gongylonema pulchrum]